MAVGKKFIRFWRRDEGSIVVEFAFIVTILSVILVGALDFGLAYTREMQMSNAVRAGTQFALARHPDIGADASASASLVSIGNIKDQVAVAAPFADDPDNQISVTMTCDCRDSGNNPITISCIDESQVAAQDCALLESQFLTISMSVPYELMLTWPGFQDQLTLSSEHTVLLVKNNIGP
ncbi:MAG: TadE/TadG family type IV pilus assembly protein [Kiloniellales bacterium]|nr:TadE/TadG family type IV pilus assembly protein [Kiloniellales bacterium]